MKARNILLLLSIATLTLTACAGAKDKNVTNDVAVDTEDIISTEMTEVIETEIPETKEIVETELEMETEETEVIIISEEVQHIKDEDKNINFDEYPWLETGEDPTKTHYYGVTWTASNGYELKINDANAQIVVEDGYRGSDAIYNDGTEDLKPNSDYMNAMHEFIYSDPAYHNGEDRYNPEVVNVDNLPKVSTVTEKKASFDTEGELKTYADEWTIYSTFQATGKWEYNILYVLQVNEDFVGSAAMGQGYLWDIERESDYWKLTIRSNLSELDWHGILTTLKTITPDAEAVFNLIYTEFYDGNEWINKPIWYDIPDSNSKILVPDYTGKTEIIFNFK